MEAKAKAADESKARDPLTEGDAKAAHFFPRFARGGPGVAINFGALDSTEQRERQHAWRPIRPVGLLRIFSAQVRSACQAAANQAAATQAQAASDASVHVEGGGAAQTPAAEEVDAASRLGLWRLRPALALLITELPSDPYCAQAQASVDALFDAPKYRSILEAMQEKPVYASGLGQTAYIRDLAAHLLSYFRPSEAGHPVAEHEDIGEQYCPFVAPVSLQLLLASFKRTLYGVEPQVSNIEQARVVPNELIQVLRALAGHEVKSKEAPRWQHTHFFSLLWEVCQAVVPDSHDKPPLLFHAVLVCVRAQLDSACAGFQREDQGLGALTTYTAQYVRRIIKVALDLIAVKAQHAQASRAAWLCANKGVRLKKKKHISPAALHLALAVRALVGVSEFKSVNALETQLSSYIATACKGAQDEAKSVAQMQRELVEMLPGFYDPGIFYARFRHLVEGFDLKAWLEWMTYVDGASDKAEKAVPGMTELSALCRRVAGCLEAFFQGEGACSGWMQPYMHALKNAVQFHSERPLLGANMQVRYPQLCQYLASLGDPLPAEFAALPPTEHAVVYATLCVKQAWQRLSHVEGEVAGLTVHRSPFLTKPLAPPFLDTKQKLRSERQREIILEPSLLGMVASICKYYQDHASGTRSYKEGCSQALQAWFDGDFTVKSLALQKAYREGRLKVGECFNALMRWLSVASAALKRQWIGRKPILPEWVDAVFSLCWWALTGQPLPQPLAWERDPFSVFLDPDEELRRQLVPYADVTWGEVYQKICSDEKALLDGLVAVDALEEAEAFDALEGGAASPESLRGAAKTSLFSVRASPQQAALTCLKRALSSSRIAQATLNDAEAQRALTMRWVLTDDAQGVVLEEMMPWLSLPQAKHSVRALLNTVCGALVEEKLQAAEDAGARSGSGGAQAGLAVSGSNGY